MRERAALDRLLEPDPLEDGRLVEGGGSVVVELEELRGPASVVREIHAAVQVRIAAQPGIAYEIPVPFGDRQANQIGLVAYGAAHEILAQLVKLRRGPLDIILDLIQREAVIRGFVPIRLPADRVIAEAEPCGLIAPVRPLRH